MRWTKDDFWICDDPKEIPAQSVVRLHREVYGIDAYSEETVRRLLNTSFWLGLYSGSGELVGFARAITDTTTLSYLCDIVIDSKFRRIGLGTWMMQCFLAHPFINQTSIGLGTNDAEQFYGEFDFERVSTMRRIPHP